MTRVLDLETPAGTARAYVDDVPAGTSALATLVLGHGAGGGSEARDLVALARALPAHGIAVVRVDQPWRVAGRKVAPPPPVLDRAWLALVPQLPAARALVLGGRSAGARVACRTAGQLGATGVLALAFPLHPPGRPERSRADELLGCPVPVLVCQGERDAFGGPHELPPGPQVHAVHGADHGMRVPARHVASQAEVLGDLTQAVASWVRTVSEGL